MKESFGKLASSKFINWPLSSMFVIAIVSFGYLSCLFIGISTTFSISPIGRFLGSTDHTQFLFYSLIITIPFFGILGWGIKEVNIRQRNFVFSQGFTLAMGMDQILKAVPNGSEDHKALLEIFNRMAKNGNVDIELDENNDIYDIHFHEGSIVDLHRLCFTIPTEMLESMKIPYF